MVKQREGLAEILKTGLEVKCQLSLTEASLGREIYVEMQSRNTYLKRVWSDVLMYAELQA